MATHRTAVAAPLGTTWAFGTTWGRAVSARLGAVVLAVVVAAGFALPAQDASAPAGAEPVQVIVRQVAAAGDAAERAATALGGRIVHRLEIIDGFVAELPGRAVHALASSPAVQSVTPDRTVRLFGEQSENALISGDSPLSHVRKVTGSTVSDRKGYDGTGIGVALIDTGVAEVAGLPNLKRGGDLASGSMPDGYGHGTHLAGIIAGNDQGTTNENFTGVAADANVVSVRAADDDGSTSLVQVLASLDWVGHYRSDQNIRVLNLSLGVTPTADYRTDILSYAVEQLWHAGIVTVVAAGNDGEKEGSPITSPAYNPWLIAVGSVDTKGTVTHDDDVRNAFSPLGSEARRVDLVAPGQSLVSLRAPGSYAAESFPSAHVGERFIKGTGTSQAAAVVAGAVADLLEQRPELTPNQVKSILRSGATPLPTVSTAGQGAGMVNVKKALTQKTPEDLGQPYDRAYIPVMVGDAGAFIVPPPPNPNAPATTWDIMQGPPSPPAATDTDVDGDGILDSDTDGDGDLEPTGWSTDGTWDADGTYTGGTWTGGTWTADGTSWTGGTWTGGTWTGGTWTGGTWTIGTWSGGTWTSDGAWTGGTWTGQSFTGGTWTGGTWTGGTWTGGTWTGGTWTGGTWTGGTWTGGDWTGGTWTGGTWTGGTWTGGTWTIAGTDWSGGTWTGGTWTGGTWTGGTWTGGTWTGGTWTGGTWTGGTWTGGTWTGGTWTSGGTWTGGTWTGGTWTGGTWTSGGTWTGGTWTGGTWTGNAWSGGTWTGGTWTGGTWTGGTWTHEDWAGGTWTGGTWTDGTWTGAAWTGTTWS